MTDSPGLFLLGLTWQYTRTSALLGWVGTDAAYLAGLHGVGLNDGFAARTPAAKLTAECERLRQELADGAVDDTTVYLVAPALVADRREAQPLGVVGQHFVAVQLFGEDAADLLNGLFIGHAGREHVAGRLVKAGGLPHIRGHFNNEGRSLI